MEDYQHEIHSSPRYPTSRKLVRQSPQPYEADDLDDTPLEEDPKVLPLPSQSRLQESLAEDVIGRSGRRKSSSSSQRKTKSTTGKPKTSKSGRSTSTASTSPLFVDELQKLEARADRINQLLAERAKKRNEQQSQAVSGISGSSSQAMYTQQQYHGVSRPPNQEQSASLGAEELEKTVAPSWNPHFWEERMDPRRQQQAKQEAWQTAQDLRYLNQPESAGYGGEGLPGLEGRRPSFRQPPTAATHPARSSGFSLRRLGWERFLDIPRKPLERITDGMVWMGIGAIVRMMFRFILMAFPGLSPVLTLLMLTPAMLAVMLVLFFPRMGWVPFYRLFLVTLGLLIGGQF